MEILRSDLGMMYRWVMLSEVVCKIFLTWQPVNSELFSCNLICNLKVLHFHISECSFLNGLLHFQWWWNPHNELVWVIEGVTFLQE